MLYQTLALEYPALLNQFTLPPGILGTLEVNLTAGQSIILRMNQLLPDPRHLPQDQTIRCWISDAIGGIPQPVYTVQWTLTSLQRRVITVYDSTANIPAPAIGYAVSLEPGRYWLNVLNLVNEANSFYLEIDTGS